MQPEHHEDDEDGPQHACSVAPRRRYTRPMAAKPAILAVDDDAPVLRAIERDLRARYGDEYRVIGRRLRAPMRSRWCAS